MTLVRTLEPELMDDPEESRSYDAMDHSTVNRQFVVDLLACGTLGEKILDLGTGTAQIPIELARQESHCKIVASDAAASMLDIARENIAAAGLHQRIELHLCDSKLLNLTSQAFDCVMSNSLIHHLPEPLIALQQMVRVVKPDGRLFVRDLMRPSSAAQVESLVAEYAGQETEYNQQLLRQSLHAALSLDEIRELVQQVGLAADCTDATSDRHWTLNTVVNASPSVPS